MGTFNIDKQSIPAPALKPCPFCGETNLHTNLYISPDGFVRVLEVGCKKCNFFLKEECGTIHETLPIDGFVNHINNVVGKWNTRA